MEAWVTNVMPKSAYCSMPDLYETFIFNKQGTYEKSDNRITLKHLYLKAQNEIHELKKINLKYQETLRARAVVLRGPFPSSARGQQSTLRAA